MDQAVSTQSEVEVAGQLRHLLAEHDAGDRLVLHRGVFSAVNGRINDDLYSRVRKGSVERQRFSISMAKGSRLDTDTYFGRFAAAYFQRWTTVQTVRLALQYATEGRLLLRIRASDALANRRTLSAFELTGSGAFDTEAVLDSYFDGGSLWVELTALDGAAEVSDLGWDVPAPERISPAAVGICTFNRADDCIATIGAIASDGALLGAVDGVVVVDQGTDTLDSRPAFAGVTAELGEKLVYLQQPNLGGAGGFSRSMFEITAGNSGANIILMDDDILCEPESILRMNAFANVTREPTLVGAQMLYLMNPERLHASAERADLGKLLAGRWAPYARHNANLLKAPKHDRRVDAEYNAWWSCLIPAEVVDKIGLPLPVFFQWDDIEFGLRARDNGFVTVTLPNAGVWHADFSWKDRDDWAKYFSIRNSLIAAALHSEIDTKALSKRLVREITQYLVSMQYGLALTMMRGIEDFLVGPSILADGGQQALLDIRAERKPFAESVVHREGEVPGIPDTLMVQAPPSWEPDKSMIDAVLAKRLAYQLAGRTRREVAVIPSTQSFWWHVSLFETAVVTDAAQGGVRVRRRDREQLVALLKRLRVLMRQFKEQTPEVSRAYRDALPRLTARENWARLYGV